ncbi:aspartyl-phosphate phosphatase Spo0E family protein [Lysinibacillus antri]|uniref:Aspartyl-phosphate phosphatase Spo0E family protein n=1 Tax=Lysinibacillus antri TaxID=2498145 RepID=A0A3S0P464_9BACI|nr:aspartyl-phosphate phosphatase Spo0E family protein [Lysinibacillus antri]RUL48791.1 aspartyl-phosphate phosphatase Spo0E family protein [Lysinibacillus antri]
MVVEYSMDLEIESKFHQLQTMMIDVGMVKGLAHPETVKYSQELDMLINHIQKISPIINNVTNR